MSWWESVVQIRCSDGDKGSGVFISQHEVLTAAHVVSRNGQALDVADLDVEIRYQMGRAQPAALAVLPTWLNSGSTGGDIALIRVDSHPDLGLPTTFGVPQPSSSVMLEGVGFEAQNDTAQQLTGNVQCRLGPAGERFLYSQDIAPVGGMSGGPLCSGVASAVSVAGIFIRASGSGLIGLSVTAALLAQLRQQF